MPELPEVEIVKQSWMKFDEKRSKSNCKKQRLRMILPNDFKKQLENKKIRRVTRFSNI